MNTSHLSLQWAEAFFFRRDEMIIAGTGHRPEKLGGYSKQVADRLTDLAVAAIKQLKPSLVISGMALGWDTALAKAAIETKTWLLAAIPFKGQESKWPEQSKMEYCKLIERAHKAIVLFGEGYSPIKMQKRNEWMVDEADMILALWDGSSGGTSNCIEYANRVGKPIRNLWKSWVKHKGF